MGPVPARGQPWKLDTWLVRAVGELDENGVFDRFEHREIVQTVPDPHGPEPV